MTFVGGIHEGRGTFLVLGTGEALLAMQDVTDSIHIAWREGREGERQRERGGGRERLNSW